MNNLIKVESWNSFVFVVDEMKAGIPKFEHFIIFQHFKWKQRKGRGLDDGSSAKGSGGEQLYRKRGE